MTERKTQTYEIFRQGVDGSKNTAFFAASDPLDNSRKDMEWLATFEVPVEKDRTFMQIVNASRGKTAAQVKAALEAALK